MCKYKEQPPSELSHFSKEHFSYWKKEYEKLFKKDRD